MIETFMIVGMQFSVVLVLGTVILSYLLIGIATALSYALQYTNSLFKSAAGAVQKQVSRPALPRAATFTNN